MITMTTKRVLRGRTVNIAELRGSWPSARRGTTRKLKYSFRVFPRYVPRISAISIAVLFFAALLYPLLYAQDQKIISSTNQQYQNMCRNASFESWSSGTSAVPDAWTGVNGPSYAKLTADKMIGAGSLKVTASATGQGVSQAITVEPNTTYTASFYYKVDSGASMTFNITGSQELINQAGFNSTSWKRVSYAFYTLPADTSVTIKMTANGAYSFYIDGVMLTKGYLTSAYADYVITDTGDQTIYGNIATTGTVDGVDVSAHAAATGASAHGLGTISTQNANNVAITGGSITGITDLAVTDGGTGTSTGSITGTGALTFTAGGTNQNVTLAPSGTGYTLLSGNVGIGATAPIEKLDLIGNIRIANSNGQANGLGTNTDGILLFYRNNPGNNQIAMVIDDESGNVGIGTTNPGAALAVGADAFKVTSAGVVTAGTWNGTALIDSYVSDTLTASKFVGSGSTTDAVDLAASEVAGVLPDANVANDITLTNITQITNRSHTSLSDIGTNTHAAIDTHISADANVHGIGSGNSVVGTGTTQALTSKTIDADNNTISNIEVDNFKSSAVGTATTLGTSDSVLPTQNAVKVYVDNSIAGLKWKQSVKAATTANGVIGSSFAAGQAIDGYTLQTGDRILIKDQTTASQNGVYIVTAGAPTRATDADLNTELISAAIFVEQGTLNSDTAWVCSTNSIPTLNTDDVNFSQFAGSQVYQAGDGLAFTANQINIDVSDFAGAGLEDDGSENLRIASSLAGAGLTGGAGSALAVGEGAGISVAADAVSHLDTSSQASIDNSSGSVLQDIALDTFGHITSASSMDLDSRYFTETESDARYLAASGGTVSSNLSIASTTPPDLILDNTTVGSDANSGALYFRGNDFTNPTNTQLDMSMKLNVTSPSDYKLSFYDDSASPTQLMYLDQSGNLNVAGTITAAGLAGTTSTSGTSSTTFEIGTGQSAGLILSQSGLTTSDKTFTFPDLSGAVVTTDATQTLTNKTITAVSNGLTVGTSQLVVSGGNVGIGTTAPGAILDIKPTLDNGIVIRESDSSNIAQALVADTSQGTADYYLNGTATVRIGGGAAGGTAYAVKIQGSGNSYFNAGNVGISQTSPTYKLDITGDIRSTTGAYFATSSGNVGVGTTAPMAKLDILSGNIRISNAASPYGVGVFGDNNVYLADNQYLHIPTGTYKATSTGTSNRFTVAFDTGFQFFNGASAASDTAVTNTEVMRLSATGGLSLGSSYVGTNPGAGSMIISGNVGIGTTAPASKLEVTAGDISIGNTRKLNLEGSGGDTFMYRTADNRVVLSVDGIEVADWVKK